MPAGGGTVKSRRRALRRAPSARSTGRQVLASRPVQHVARSTPSRSNAGTVGRQVLSSPGVQRADRSGGVASRAIQTLQALTQAGPRLPTIQGWQPGAALASFNQPNTPVDQLLGKLKNLSSLPSLLESGNFLAETAPSKPTVLEGEGQRPQPPKGGPLIPPSFFDKGHQVSGPVKQAVGTVADVIGSPKKIGPLPPVSSPFAYKQRLFAHPQRPAAGPSGKAQLAGKVPNLVATPLTNTKRLGPPGKNAPPLTASQKRSLLNSPKGKKLSKQGYSNQDILSIAATGKPAHAKGRFGQVAPQFGTGTDRGVITAAAKRHGVPPEILWGVYGAESNFGKNKNNSTAGAQGPFQFMPGTADTYVPGGRANIRNFPKAAEGAARYLRELYNQRGRDWGQAAAGYNAGGGVSRNPSAWPGETQRYVPEVKRLAKTYANAKGNPVPMSLPTGPVTSVGPSAGVPSTPTAPTQPNTAVAGTPSSVTSPTTAAGATAFNPFALLAALNQFSEPGLGDPSQANWSWLSAFTQDPNNPNIVTPSSDLEILRRWLGI